MTVIGIDWIYSGTLKTLEWLWTIANPLILVRLVKTFSKHIILWFVTAELEDGTPPEFDHSSCQAQGTIPPFNEYLNVNAPLQLGGLYVEQFDPTHYHWQYMPVGKSFDGCIRNLFHNSKLYDLAHPGLSRNSQAGCPQTEEMCHKSDTTSR